jgi:hypothetical protein
VPFWKRRGFVHVDTIDGLPGWDPGTSYIAALRPTRSAPMGQAGPDLGNPIGSCLTRGMVVAVARPADR